MAVMLSPCATCVRSRSRGEHPALRWSRWKSGAWTILPPVSRRLRRARICYGPKHGPTESHQYLLVHGRLGHTASLRAGAEVCKHSANEHQESGLVAHDGDVPLQGVVSSNRNTLPGGSRLVSPSVVVMEKTPCRTMPN